MRLYIRRDIGVPKAFERMFRRIAGKVIERFEKELENFENVSIILSLNPIEECEQILKDLIPDDAKRAILSKYLCEQASMITLFPEPEKARIVVNLKDASIRRAIKWEDALTGILAHEIAHVALKALSKDDEIVRVAKETENELKKTLRKGVGGNMLFSSIVLMLKDELVNELVLRKRFHEELFRHYDNQIELKVPHRELYGEELLDLFYSALSLLPAFVPFEKVGDVDRALLTMQDIKIHMPDVYQVIKKVDPVRRWLKTTELPPKRGEMLELYSLVSLSLERLLEEGITI